MKKVIISILLVFFISLEAEDNVTITDINSTIAIDINQTIDTNSSVVIDINQTVVPQIKPTIEFINIDAKDDEVLVSGIATPNHKLELVLLYDNTQRIVHLSDTKNDGNWSIKLTELNQVLNDGAYELYISTKNNQEMKSEITSIKELIRDTSIYADVSFSIEIINTKNRDDLTITGKIDNDSIVKNITLYNENNQTIKNKIALNSIIYDEEFNFKVNNQSISIDNLDDGELILELEVEDKHKNSLTVKKTIQKDITIPQVIKILKSVKDNNMINGQANKMVVYQGIAEEDSTVTVTLYNEKYKTKTTTATVKTDQALRWTIIGSDLNIKSLKNGTIVSKIFQTDKNGNDSKVVIQKIKKEKNPIFPLNPKLIDGEDYMAVHTIKAIDDKVKSLVVSQQNIIAGSFEFLYYFDKKFIKLLKKVEIKDRWVNKLLIVKNKLIVALDNGAFQVRDLKSGKLLKNIKAHTMPILFLSYDEKSDKLVTSSSNGNMKIWNFSTYKELQKLKKHQWDVHSTVIDDGKIYSGSDDYSIKIWDLKDAKLIKNIKSAHNGTINSLAIYKDKLISASDDALIHIRDKNTGIITKTLKGHKKGVTAIKVNHDTLVSTSKDRTVIVWSLNRYEKQKQLRGHSKAIISLDIQDENIITSSLDYKVRVWGYDPSLEGLGDTDEAVLAKYDLIKSIPISKNTITSLAQTEQEFVFSTFGEIFFYNNVTYEFTRKYSSLDKITKIKKEKDSSDDGWGESEESTSSTDTQDDGWSDESDDEDELSAEDRLEKEKNTRVEEGNKKPQFINTINIQGNILTAGMQYNKIKKWDLERNKAVALLEAHDASIKSINRTEGLLITSSSDGMIKVWDDETDEMILSIEAHQWDVRDTVADDLYIYSASDDYSIKVWSLESGDLVKSIKSAHKAEVTSLLIYENFLISCGLDGKIIYRDKESLKIVKVLEKHTKGINTMAQDEEHLITGGEENNLIVWDIATGSYIATLKGGHTDEITAIMITDDYIISGGKDKKISIWKYYE